MLSISRALAAPTPICATPRSTQRPSARQQASRCSAVRTFESSSPLVQGSGETARVKDYRGCDDGPASGPRPASSMPQTIPSQRRSIAKFGIAPPTSGFCHARAEPSKESVGGAMERARNVAMLIHVPALPPISRACHARARADGIVAVNGRGDVSARRIASPRLQPLCHARGHRPVRDRGRQAAGQRRGAGICARRSEDAGWRPATQILRANSSLTPTATGCGPPKRAPRHRGRPRDDPRRRRRAATATVAVCRPLS